jgi:hypothetical protein
MKFDLIAPLLPKSLPLVNLTLRITDALRLLAPVHPKERGMREVH